jgi:hypothetical protein
VGRRPRHGGFFTAFFGAVVGDWVLLAVTADLEGDARPEVLREDLLHSIGTLLGQHVTVGGRTKVVGEADGSCVVQDVRFTSRYSMATA